MITLAPGLRVYLACGVTDMRKGMTGLAMLVQQGLAEDPFGGAVFAFRGRRATLIKLVWHDQEKQTLRWAESPATSDTNQMAASGCRALLLRPRLD